MGRHVALFINICGLGFVFGALISTVGWAGAGLVTLGLALTTVRYREPS